MTTDLIGLLSSSFIISIMKAFIIFLNKLPEYPQSEIHDIQVDLDCMKELYKIYNNGKEED